MAFADLKNDYIFRRIFATHPDILRRLLNDLLERTGDPRSRTIPRLIKLVVPRSSAAPQRPQFESSFMARR